MKHSLNTALTIAALFVGPALALQLAPESVRTALVFDRDAIAHGEWWRLATGHWIHFGLSHLGWNLAAVSGVAWWLEKIKPGIVGRFLAIAAPALGVMLFLLEPAMHTYGGLSGIACGLTALLALVQLFHAHAGRIWGLLLLVVIAVKITLETTQAAPLFSEFDHAGYRLSTWAHAGGVLIAAGFFLSRPRANSAPLPLAAASSYDEILP